MKILAHKEAHFRDQIREMIALDPMISIRGIQKLLEANTGRSISDKYVSSLLRKVQRQAIILADQKKLSDRLAEVRDRQMALRSQLLRIAYWTPQYVPMYGIHKPKSSERISAIKTIAQMDIALLKAELDVGLFEDKRIHLHQIFNSDALAPQLREEIIAVCRRYEAPLSIAGEEASGSDAENYVHDSN